MVPDFLFMRKQTLLKVEITYEAIIWTLRHYKTFNGNVTLLVRGRM